MPAAELRATRAFVHDCIAKRLYPTACTFARMLVQRSGQDASDVLLLGLCYYHDSQYARSVATLRDLLPRRDSTSDFQYQGPLGRFCSAPRGSASTLAQQLEACRIASFCHLASEKYDLVLELLSRSDKFAENWLRLARGASRDESAASSAAAFAVARALAYEGLERSLQATSWYILALKLDFRCSQALERLVDCKLLSRRELLSLVEQLECPASCSWLNELYTAQIDHALPSDKVKELNGRVASATYVLAEDLVDFATAECKRLSFQGKHGAAYELCAKWRAREPNHTALLLPFVNSLVALKKHADLMFLARNLLSLDPESAMSWYATGACDMASEAKTAITASAVQHFERAISIDFLFPEAWIALGNALRCARSASAMATFEKAARLFRGSHAVHLCISSLFMQEMAVDRGLKSLQSAGAINSRDPSVYSEQGCAMYRMGRLAEAATALFKARSMCHPRTNQYGTVLVNLGHILRRLGRLDEALDQFNAAGLVRPNCARLWTAIAMCHHAKGDLQAAFRAYKSARMMCPRDRLTLAAERVCRNEIRTGGQ